MRILSNSSICCTVVLQRTLLRRHTVLDHFRRITESKAKRKEIEKLQQTVQLSLRLDNLSLYKVGHVKRSQQCLVYWC